MKIIMLQVPIIVPRYFPFIFLFLFYMCCFEIHLSIYEYIMTKFDKTADKLTGYMT